jgi:hypothetical protein
MVRPAGRLKEVWGVAPSPALQRRPLQTAAFLRGGARERQGVGAVSQVGPLDHLGSSCARGAQAAVPTSDSTSVVHASPHSALNPHPSRTAERTSSTAQKRAACGSCYTLAPSGGGGGGDWPETAQIEGGRLTAASLFTHGSSPRMSEAANDRARTAMLTSTDVARLTNLSRAAVYRTIEGEAFRASRLCSRLRVDPAEMEAWTWRDLVAARRRHTASPLSPLRSKNFFGKAMRWPLGPSASVDVRCWLTAGSTAGAFASCAPLMSSPA